MSLFGVLDVSATGLDVLQKRLEVTATNLANARTSGTEETVYRPLAVVVHSEQSASGQLPRPVVAGVVEAGTLPVRVHDPGHPDADRDGFVLQPGIDPVGSMLDLISIQRSYEANVRAFDITRSLLQRLLSIGGRA